MVSFIVDPLVFGVHLDLLFILKKKIKKIQNNSVYTILTWHLLWQIEYPPDIPILVQASCTRKVQYTLMYLIFGPSYT